jgi:hypothetical protein
MNDEQKAPNSLLPVDQPGILNTGTRNQRGFVVKARPASGTSAHCSKRILTSTSASTCEVADILSSSSAEPREHFTVAGFSVVSRVSGWLCKVSRECLL